MMLLTRRYDERPLLRLGPEAAWFNVGEEPAVMLKTRKPLKKLLYALAMLRLEQPDAVLSMRAAFEAGWPGEKVERDAARTRLYTAIHTLRRFGLRGILVRRHGGYVLDANIDMALPSGTLTAA